MEMWRSRIHPEDLNSVIEKFDRAKRECGIYQPEHRIIRADDGSIRWVTVFGRFQNDENGVAARFAGVFLDFTNRKRVEEALRESEGRFHTLADNIAQLAWMADETGWIFWYNHRWYDYTGTTLQGHTRLGMAERSPPRSRRTRRCALQALFRRWRGLGRQIPTARERRSIPLVSLTGVAYPKRRRPGGALVWN